MRENKEILGLLEDVKEACGMLDDNDRKFSTQYKHRVSDDKKIEGVGNEQPGSPVEVCWEQFEDPDYGYILTLPGYDSGDIYMSGIIHVPKPQGCEKCECDPEWIYIGRLLSFKSVIKIKIIKPVRR